MGGGGSPKTVTKWLAHNLGTSTGANRMQLQLRHCERGFPNDGHDVSRCD